MPKQDDESKTRQFSVDNTRMSVSNESQTIWIVASFLSTNEFRI